MSAGFDEHHEIAKANKHHNVDILIHGIVGLVVEGGYVRFNLHIDSVDDHEYNFIDNYLNDKAFHWAFTASTSVCG